VDPLIPLVSAAIGAMRACAINLNSCSPVIGLAELNG
jgi:hypothetical protein